MSELSFEQKLEDGIEFCRQIVKYDGGDFEKVSFENGILTLRLLGSCATCSSRSFTYDGIKRMFLEEFDGKIKDVKFVV